MSHEVFNQNVFVVKEHVGIFKAANNYDILDPQGQLLLKCREDKLGGWCKFLRFTKYKRMTPFHIEIKSPEDETLLQVKRPTTWFVSNVSVEDSANKKLGGFKQKFFSLGGKFTIHDPQEVPIFHLEGKWTGWNFYFKDETGKELAHISKKWQGLGKELFTTADTYAIEISNDVPKDSQVRQLIIASSMCIDMVLKEQLLSTELWALICKEDLTSQERDTPKEKDLYRSNLAA